MESDCFVYTAIYTHIHMEDVRKRFAEYKRLRQLREGSDSRASDKDESRTQEDRHKTAERVEATKSEPTAGPVASEDPHLHSNSTNTPQLSPPSTPMYMTLLKALLWLLLWGFFVEVGFGAIFFITSLLYFIIVSLRGSKRRPWEPSAYSVFNKDFESIEGTLSAEQFERELRYGPMSVKK